MRHRLSLRSYLGRVCSDARGVPTTARAQNLIFRFLQNVRRLALEPALLGVPAAAMSACGSSAPSNSEADPAPARPGQKTRVQIWLYENTDLRIEGRIIVRRPRPRPRAASLLRPRRELCVLSVLHCRRGSTST